VHPRPDYTRGSPPGEGQASTWPLRALAQVHSAAPQQPAVSHAARLQTSLLAYQRTAHPAPPGCCL